LNFNRTGAKFREVFPFGAVSVRILLALLLAVIGFVILNLALARFMVRLIPPPKFFSQFIAQTLRGQQPLAVFFTIAVILPIGEEFLFRGLILHAFLSRYRTRMAIISSAILFGLMHGNPWQFVTGVSMGIFFAWCLVRSQSLVPCLYAHFANNAIVLMLPGLQPKMPDIAKWIITHPVWIGAAGLFLAISGIYLLRELFDKMAAERKNIPAMNEAGISGNQETPADLKEN
jgi:membrane protease YdiL (CAAX protease family)